MASAVTITPEVDSRQRFAEFADRNSGRVMILASAEGGTEIEELIRRNKVSGGMVLKLEAAKRALSGGVSEVRIVGGTHPRALLAAANGGRCPGTRVLPLVPQTAARAAHGAAR